MTNLFSSFDPMVSFFFVNTSLNWSSSFIVILLFPQMFWLLGSQVSKSLEKVMVYLENELSAVMGPTKVPGTIFIFLCFFFFIIYSNLFGLLPFIFTSTSHLVMTLSLALPVWLGGMLWSMFYQYNNLFAHLVPTGTPAFLMPIMVIIESVSNVIRPGTLSIRLAANMVAGHLLLTLLGSQAESLSFSIYLGLVFSLILLLILELAVACIQSYVFTILSVLYLNELMSTSFNKSMLNK